ncbi:twin-arginine translocation signal domain-containing protein [Staphylococcus epidermidis]|nr:twin-arginine translocation signal domain-containing protein [Staphylococcus epidermidis]
MMDRRNFIQGAGVAVAAAALPSERKRRLRASLQIKRSRHGRIRVGRTDSPR